MSGNYYTPYSLRISEEMNYKLKIIAEKNKRSKNKEMELALEKHIEKYEKKYGTIEYEP